jgi:hypothetical protein
VNATVGSIFDDIVVDIIGTFEHTALRARWTNVSDTLRYPDVRGGQFLVGENVAQVPRSARVRTMVYAIMREGLGDFARRD